MIQRFCTTCDKCGKRSEEYSGWPACKSCLQSFCPECRNLALDDESEGACVCCDCYRDGSYGVFGTPPLIDQARAAAGLPANPLDAARQ